jgi:hypothetical protein
MNSYEQKFSGKLKARKPEVSYSWN